MTLIPFYKIYNININNSLFYILDIRYIHTYLFSLMDKEIVGKVLEIRNNNAKFFSVFYFILLYLYICL